MIRPVTSLGELRTPRAPVLFILVELLLLSAVPALGYLGAQSLLDTRAGNFVAQPTPTEPGWLAAVEPSPVTGIVEVLGGKVTGVTIVAQQQQSQPGGTVILVWPSVEIDGVQVGEMAPEEVVPAVSRQLGLQIPTVEILDEVRWKMILGSEERAVDNPDPIVSEDGVPVLAVGAVNIGSDLAATFIGSRAVSGDPDSVIVRRTIWWEVLLSDPPSGDDDLAALMRTIGSADHRVLDLPTTSNGAGDESGASRSIDPALAEQTIVDSVPFPVGSQPGDRTQVRILDRTGSVDLEAVARSVARLGFEVIQIGNAPVFDDGPAEVIVPAGVTDARIELLAELFGAATVYENASAAQAGSAENSASKTVETSRTITLIVSSSAAEMSTS